MALALYAAHAAVTQNFVEDACSNVASIGFSEIGAHYHFSSNALFPVHPAPPNKPRNRLSAKACDMTWQKISPLDAPLAADANRLRNQCRVRRQFQIEEHKRKTCLKPILKSREAKPRIRFLARRSLLRDLHPPRSLKGCQQPPHFVPAQHHRHPARTARPQEFPQIPQLQTQHLRVKKRNRI